MDLPDFEQVRREDVRLKLLEISNKGSLIGVPEPIVNEILRTVYPNLSRDELHHAVRYVLGYSLITLSTPDDGPWRISITSQGVDVLEGHAECPPGIACPKRSRSSGI